MASPARGIALLLLVVSVALVVAATTMPWSSYYVGHSHWAQVEWVPFSRLVRPDDMVLNVLLFVPLGFSLYLCGAAGGGQKSPAGDEAADGAASARRVRGRVLGVVIGAILLSTAVEFFQVYCHGRLPTTTDIISNALGAFFGARSAVAGEAGR